MFEVGQQFCGYEILAALGRRRHIENYQAKPLAGGGAVRLTLLSAALFANEKAQANFVAAAERLCAIQCEGVARQLLAGQDGGRVFYVSEFLPNGNFKQLLGKPMLPGQALRILRDICRALQGLHEAGVGHGNLKPGNILLGSEGRPVLTDTGITALLQLDYSLGIDPYYVSPEQVRGAAPGIASDIYSLGIILYQMLCGKPPFQADSDFRIAMLRIEEPVPELPEDYRFLVPLLEQMLTPDPRVRISSKEVLTRLEGLIVEADARRFDLQNTAIAEQGEKPMSDASDKQQATAIGEKIEKTLAEREQERKEFAGASAVPLAASGPRGGDGFGYLKLLLGLLLGVLIGVALHFVLPRGTGSVGGDSPRRMVSPQVAEADRLLASGQIDRARSAYLDEISRNPAAPQAFNNLAALYASEGDLEQAQALLKQALETNPDYLTIYRNIGTVYAAIARDSYGKALQLAGEPLPVHLELLGEQTASREILVASAEKIPAAEPAPAQEQGQTAVTLDTPSGAPQTAEKAPVPEAGPVPGAMDGGTAQLPAVQEPAAIAEPVAPAASVPPAVETAGQSPQEFLQAWARAWSSGEIETYLACYAPDFSPADGLTHEQWEEKRRKRLASPEYIEVKLESFESISGTGDSAEIVLLQSYRSDRYQDQTRKSFVLRKTPDSWLIVAERSLGRVR